MKRLLPGALAALLIAASGFSSAQAAAGILNLSCIEALAAIEQPHLAGVFSFISEKDLGAAFADLLARSRPAMRRYLAKLERDAKKAKGLTTWDHEVVVQVLGLFASADAGNFEKPEESVKKRLSKLAMAPTMTLAEMTEKRTSS